MVSRACDTTVFLADDSVLIRRRLRTSLAAEGMRVLGEAGTPQACIDEILASRPQVVVLEVRLKGGTGLQVMQAVQAATAGPAFVVFSNSSGPAYRSRYLAAGAACFLDKSAEFEQLAQAVRSAAGR